MMLRKVLASAGLDPHTCATLLGFNPRLFDEWSSGQRPIPESILPVLSAVLSVPASTLRMPAKAAKNIDEAEITPAIWYKFREPNLVEADRECVLLIRQLGHYMNQLEEVTRNKSAQWKVLFESIRSTVNLQAPPREQGRTAARILRESTSLGHGAKGSGDVLRGFLRSLGILVIETPIKESQMEGCSFYVGSPESPRPCVFANTHHVTWFRRNSVLMHEVAHSIFEALFAGASLDFADSESGRDRDRDSAEIRAEAFAQETLIPKEVLLHVAQSQGVKWQAISAVDLARIVAQTHVELRLVICAAVDAGLISPDSTGELKRTEISSLLPELSDHALSTEQYLKKVNLASVDWIGKRTTTLPSRSIRLPIGYVNAVIEAYRSRQISLGKAAEYLMIDDRDFVERFGEIAEEVAC